MNEERKEKGLRVNHQVFLKTPCDAIHYCTMLCPKNGTLGCVTDCKIRIHFQIPPHGPKWPFCKKETATT